MLSAPALLLLAALTVIPILLLFGLSLTSWSLLVPGSFKFSFVNYAERMFSDENFVHSLGVTFYYIIVNTLIQMTLGFLIAFLLFRYTKLRFLRAIMIIPMLVPPAVVGLMWKMMLIPNLGGLDYYLGLFGIPAIDWLGNPGTALAAVTIASVWEWTPFVIVVMLAGLDSLPRSPLEAAVMDGASTLKTVFYVIIPMLRPIIIVTLLLRIIESLAILPVVFMMTGGGPARATEAINLYAYHVGLEYLDIGYAASILVAFIFILLIFCTPIILSSLKSDSK
ncbi:MAG: sugar ABC transporter permease [Albidovulum sp.]|nr:sugar ABC transporter permease [Albidovulum sp.]